MFKSSLSSLSVKNRLIILAVLVSVAVALVVLDRFVSAPALRGQQIDVLDSLTVANLDSVSVKQNARGSELNFVKRADKWILVERDYQVDKNNWESFINSLNALTIMEQASERDDRKGEYGLDSAQVIIVEGFTSGKMAFTLNFGKNAAGSGILYMNDPNKKGVFMTSGLARHLIDRQPDLWIDRVVANNLFEDDIEVLRVENRDSAFVLDIKVEGVDSLGAKDYAVAVNAVAVGNVDNSKVRGYLSKVVNLRCNDVLTKGEFYDMTLFENPNMTVIITTKAGRTITYRAIPNFRDADGVSFLLLNSENNRVYEMSRHNMVSLVRREANFIIEKANE